MRMVRLPGRGRCTKQVRAAVLRVGSDGLAGVFDRDRVRLASLALRREGGTALRESHHP